MQFCWKFHGVISSIYLISDSMYAVYKTAPSTLNLLTNWESIFERKCFQDILSIFGI